eukprot:366253-Chlamydomonas_euryale.AAC.4
MRSSSGSRMRRPLAIRSHTSCAMCFCRRASLAARPSARRAFLVGKRCSSDELQKSGQALLDRGQFRSSDALTNKLVLFVEPHRQPHP